MKLAVIGDFRSPPDEGLKMASHRIARLAEGIGDCLRLDLTEAVRPHGLRALSRNAPEVVHVVAGPSPKAAAVLWACRLACPQTPRVLSALHPLHPNAFWRLSFPARPSLVFTQSKSAADVFTRLGARAVHAPLGVDLTKFRPLPTTVRDAARAELGVKSSERLVLHVGHLKLQRGVTALADAARAGWRAAMVVSSTSTPEPAARETLLKAGVQLIEGFVSDLERFYAACDVYLFPTEHSLHAVETPFSVLEALACGRPVATTRFPGLPEVFKEGEGLLFIKSAGHAVDALNKLAVMPTKNRERMLDGPFLSSPQQLKRFYALQET